MARFNRIIKKFLQHWTIERGTHLVFNSSATLKLQQQSKLQEYISEQLSAVRLDLLNLL